MIAETTPTDFATGPRRGSQNPGRDAEIVLAYLSTKISMRDAGRPYRLSKQRIKQILVKAGVEPRSEAPRPESCKSCGRKAIVSRKTGWCSSCQGRFRKFGDPTPRRTQPVVGPGYVCPGVNGRGCGKPWASGEFTRGLCHLDYQRSRYADPEIRARQAKAVKAYHDKIRRDPEKAPRLKVWQARNRKTYRNKMRGIVEVCPGYRRDESLKGRCSRCRRWESQHQPLTDPAVPS